MHGQTLVSVVKMATMLQEYTTEEQHPGVFFFCVQKDSMQRIVIKICFLFMVGSVCSIRKLTTGSINSLKDIQKFQMMLNQLQKWLKQQYLYAVGFDTLVKRWDKCINVGEGYVEK
jgi:hypothetical protein